MVDPDHLNLELFHRLRGCALICELDIDEERHADLTAAMQVLDERGVTQYEGRLWKYAPLVATYLVAEGIFNFAQGTYWPNLSVRGPDRGILTRVFEHVLETYPNLERFNALIDAGAQRYVTPILAHGGIPRYSLHDFFAVVLHADKRGASDASEMLAYWREYPSAFANIDKPVERFLLHGGDISVDFLDRCLDLVRSRPKTTQDLPSDRFGLPAYVCDAYLQLDPAVRRPRDMNRLAPQVASIPRPFIFLDPWDASGPMLCLPAIASSPSGNWEVVSQERAARYVASRSDRIFTLEPALHWSVEMRDESGGSMRTFTFPGLARGNALFFDYDDGRLISDLSRMRTTRAWALRPDGDGARLRRASGEELIPLESAPPPAGSWNGYVLDAYELPDGERICIGPGSGATDQPESAATTFWVRIRGERIRLEGETLDGVRTSDGLPVYSETPRLILPGFTQLVLPTEGQHHAKWFLRVSCGEMEHIFDGEDLLRLGEDVLRSVVSTSRSSRVSVTARGPLGMDMRTTFCVVPGLVVNRPQRVLLPANDAAHVIAHVVLHEPTGDVQRHEVFGGIDAIDASVHDGQGHTVEIRITVPILQWAFISGGNGRSDLQQQPLRLSTRDILDDGVALLAVRAWTSGVPLRLELRDGEHVLQALEALTAGDEGRWTFDLRRFTTSVRSSSEPVLSLALLVNGFQTPLGEVRAELEVSDLLVHQRVVPGNSTVSLTWNEVRSLSHRVARLWPLSTPWVPPVSEPVPDSAGCEVTISRDDADLPPGCYLAEIGIDDGWTTIRRPHLLEWGTREFRLGTDHDERAWLARLDDNDPHAVLTGALAYGMPTRTLSPHEAELITPAALDALWLAREQGRGNAATRILEGVTSLITVDQDSLVAGVEAMAGNWEDSHDAPLLAAVLDVLASLPHSPAALAPPHESEKLWEVCPPLAAALDLRHTRSTVVRVRSEAGLGATIQEALRREVIPSVRGRSPELQRFIQMPLEVLEVLRRASSLVPKRPLDLDSQAAVQFEWLIADKRRMFSAEGWCATHRGLVASLHELQPHLVREFESLRAHEHLLAAFPALRLPELVHLAALITITGAPSAWRAVVALRELVQACPGIANRALVVAAVHANISAGSIDANA